MLFLTKAPSPKGDITLVKITNINGASVVLSTLGAGIVEVNVPDASGKMENVVLGYANPADYIADGPCAGKVPGRYANRIAEGHLVIDGKTYGLPINNGPNHLHGGPEGFQNQIWDITIAGDNFVEMTLHSTDGEQCYPGNLTAVARYLWTDDNTLELELSATTDADTVVNLTNHAYWNLAGENSGSALKHVMTLKASKYLPTDENLIPTGEEAPVAGTPMDFTTAKEVGRDINADFAALKYGKGYDNCWVIDNYVPGQVQEVATLTDPVSGRVLTVRTDQPGVQVYTGNWLAGSPKNKEGRSYNDYDGIAIECQDFPDAPNKPAFPSTELKPGQEYRRRIIFEFTNK